jgi:preprotein translocase subunit SecA
MGMSGVLRDHGLHARGVATSAAYAQRIERQESALDQWARSRIGQIQRQLDGSHAVLRRQVRTAQALTASVQPLSDDALCSRLRLHALVLWRDSDHAAEQLPHALALVREAARRSLGLQPYATQLMGAACLLQGRLAEMQTGEGKTLTAALAAAVAACAGVPVHVATVNDYLAQRDAQELRPLFSFLGLNVGSVVSGMVLGARRAAYGCDVTYCNAKELVFDYLKDRTAVGHDCQPSRLAIARLLGPAPQALLLRGLHFAIVDEADGVFIDEARTPLILSEAAGPAGDPQLYQEALALAAAMQREAHFQLQTAQHHLALTAAGRGWLTERCLTMRTPWAQRVVREHLVVQALRALWLYQCDQHYIVKAGKVQIVDEQTGRVLEGRSWEQGLHQMIECKEGCALSAPARTVARITYQRFFQRYLRLSGMTGTAREVAPELWRVYGLQTVVVPTHRPSQRQLLPTLCVNTTAQKWRAVAERAAELMQAGRAVLIGTRSVQASEALSEELSRSGLHHRLLNARQDADEAALVASAGTPGTLTVATNMAGRGTDIKLHAIVKARGGLHVILTEFHDSARVDRQLFGRAARQGDPGSAEAIVSLQDTLFVQHAGVLSRAVLALRAAKWPAGADVHAITLLRRCAQRQAECIHARTRAAAMRQDQHLETSLAFAGRS